MFTRKLWVVAVVCLGLFAMAASASGTDIKVYPQNLNLNSEGITEPITVVIKAVVPIQYTMTNYEANLYINSNFVVSAYMASQDDTLGVVYAYFDRSVVRQYCIDRNLTGGISVMVSGWFDVANETETLQIPFAGFDYIEVVAPGNKLPVFQK